MAFKTVLVAGDFGKFHPGHVDHIRKASALGDFLYVITHQDDSIRQRKGYEPDPLAKRLDNIGRLMALHRINGTVGLAVDDDGTVAKTLELYRPDIFAKGGDRGPNNMPSCELEVCKKLGIEIRYGIGDKLGESRVIARMQRV